MKHIIPITIAILLIGLSTVTAQEISRSVIAPAGSSDVAGDVKLDWTLGETSAETIEFGDHILTVGFQQPTIRVIKLASNKRQAAVFDVVVYPNPFSEQITIEPKSQEDIEFEILISDVAGKLVLSDKARTADGPHTISVNGLSAGTYFIRFNTDEIQYYPSHQIIKIQ